MFRQPTDSAGVRARLGGAHTCASEARVPTGSGETVSGVAGSPPPTNDIRPQPEARVCTASARRRGAVPGGKADETPAGGRWDGDRGDRGDQCRRRGPRSHASHAECRRRDPGVRRGGPGAGRPGESVGLSDAGGGDPCRPRTAGVRGERRRYRAVRAHSGTDGRRRRESGRGRPRTRSRPGGVGTLRARPRTGSDTPRGPTGPGRDHPRRDDHRAGRPGRARRAGSNAAGRRPTPSGPSG